MFRSFSFSFSSSLLKRTQCLFSRQNEFFFSSLSFSHRILSSSSSSSLFPLSSPSLSLSPSSLSPSSLSSSSLSPLSSPFSCGRRLFGTEENKDQGDENKILLEKVEKIQEEEMKIHQQTKEIQKEEQDLRQTTKEIQKKEKNLHHRIKELEEREQRLIQEIKDLKEELGRGATRPGSEYGPSDKLSFLSGIVRNGPMNLFYVHHPHTNEHPFFDRTNTHIGAWATLVIFTGTMIGLQFYWSRHLKEFTEIDNVLSKGIVEEEGKARRLTFNEKENLNRQYREEIGILENMENNLMVSYSALREGRLWTLLTSCFAHMDSMHLMGNLIALWLFSFKLLRIVGPLIYISVYCGGGVAASIAEVVKHVYFNQVAKVPGIRERIDLENEIQNPRTIFDQILGRKQETEYQNYDYPCLGASGSVMATAGAAAAMFPKDKVVVRIAPFPLPFPVAVALYAATDFIGLRPELLKSEHEKSQDTPKVAHAAHLGGVVMGILLGLTFRRYQKIF